MSQENIEVVRRLTEAMVRADPDSFVACCSPDVDWEENTAAFFGLRANYRGHEAIREWFQEAIGENWDAISFEIKENEETPEGRVRTGGVLTAPGKGRGVRTRRPYWFSDGVRNGKNTRTQ